MTSILIIDDDGIVRDALNVFLTRAGYRVITAADGANGIQAFKSSMPDLVVLDRNLPGVSGSGVFATIRRISKTTPVIILSGYHDPEEVDSYLRGGAAAFLSKGDGLSPVLAEVERLAGARGSRSSPEPEEPKAAEAAAFKTVSGRSAGLVLIADDDPSTRAVLRRFLSSLSYRTLEAADGAAALQLARAHKPDIVLLDISMPERNGVEVLVELASEMPGTGFMMITGKHDEALARECLKNGAFDYVAIPINLACLKTIIGARLTVQTKQG